MARIFQRINYLKVTKLLTFAIYPAGLLGMSVLAFDVGSFHLFPYRILILIIWLCLIFSVIKNKGILDLPPIKVKNFGLFLLFWLIYAVLSINWAIDKISAVKHVISLFTSLSLIVFTAVFLETVKDLCVVTKIWLIFLGLTLIIGILETVYGVHLPVSLFYQRDTVVPTGFFYNPNDFATYLSLSAPFLLSYLLFNKKAQYRLLFLFPFFILIYVLVSTGSRANFLAVFLEIVYFIIVAYSFRKNRKELYVLITGSLLTSLLFPKRILDQLNSFIITLQSLAAQISNQMGSIGIRINLARNGLLFLLSTWGFGVGAGNVEGWMQTRARFDSGHMTNIHNWFLEVLVNYGIFVFVGYLLFYLGMIYKILYVIKTHRNDHKLKVVGVAILGSMIGFIFASMSPSSIIAFKPHWMIFAIGLSYINIGLNQTPGEKLHTQ